MNDKINGRTPEEIKKGLECCNMHQCPLQKCPYFDIEYCGESLNVDALAYIQQLERERDAAVEQLVKFEYPIPCESYEMGGSEYCEESCNFKSPQKECWLEYFRRLEVQE